MIKIVGRSPDFLARGMIGSALTQSLLQVVHSIAMASFKSIAELDAYLATRSYIEGYALSEADTKVFAIYGASALASKTTNKNAYRWGLHIAALSGLGIAFESLSIAPTVTTTEASKPAAKADDFDDMFGGEEKPVEAAKVADMDDMFNYGDDADEEDAEDAAASKARRERIALAAKMKKEKDLASGTVKKDKEKPAEKSLVVLEVKPWEADTNLEELWKEITKYEQAGLQWGASFKLEPVAYGIMKLVMTCTIVDSLVLMDDVTDAIEKLEDFVQSVQVASMNKV